METVSFGVEWLSENQFRMTYDDKDDEFDEEYIIMIPEWTTGDPKIDSHGNILWYKEMQK